jgi:hypothetical protein
MDKEEARDLLAKEVAALRTWSYQELRGLLYDEAAGEVLGPSGAKYQVESYAVWDDKKGGALRVIAAIDDGGLRAFAPMSESFIIAPDGSVVGE